jgi:hypothetical protein
MISHSCDSVDAGDELKANEAACCGSVYSSNASLTSRPMPSTGRTPRKMDALGLRGGIHCDSRSRVRDAAAAEAGAFDWTMSGSI